MRVDHPKVAESKFHAAFLYRNTDDLGDRLATLLLHPDRFMPHWTVLADMMARHSWASVIGRYDRELESLAGTGGGRSDAR